MTEKKGKWASRHRKIEKSGYQATAKMISFPRRWHGGMISANQEATWGMSAKKSHDLLAKHLTPTQIAEAKRLAREWLEHFRFILVHTHLRQSSFGILGY